MRRTGRQLLVRACLARLRFCRLALRALLHHERVSIRPLGAPQLLHRLLFRRLSRSLLRPRAKREQPRSDRPSRRRRLRQTVVVFVVEEIVRGCLVAERRATVRVPLCVQFTDRLEKDDAVRTLGDVQVVQVVRCQRAYNLPRHHIFAEEACAVEVRKVLSLLLDAARRGAKPADFGHRAGGFRDQ